MTVENNRENSKMKMPNFSEWFPGTEEGKGAAKAEVTERQAMVQGVAERRDGLRRDLPGLIQGVDTAMKKFTATQQAQTDAGLEVQRANHAVQQVRLRADSQIAQLEQRLRAGAIPGIREFLSELAGVWDKERLRWHNELAPRDSKGVPMPAKERVDQIRAIRQQAGRLCYEPCSDAAERKLERLRSEVALPTTEALVT